MSGGAFDYDQYRIRDIAESIECEIYQNSDKYESKTIEEFKNAVDLLNKAEIYATRVDYLISGDDGEESFHKRLNEDLEKHEGYKNLLQLINGLYSSGSLYYFMASLISAENLTSIEACDESEKMLNMIIENIHKIIVSEEETDKIINYCYEGKEICKNEKINIASNSID